MKTVSRRPLCKPNGFLSVEIHEVQLPDGRRIDNWPWVVTPDYVNVLARTVDGQFLCLRQAKYAFDGDSLAAVGGYIEPGEDPLVAARRELLEETGYTANEWHPLGSYVIDANRGVATAHLYLALDAQFDREADPGDLEELELLFLSQSELETALAAGQFKVLAWTTVVALALQKLSREPQPEESRK